MAADSQAAKLALGACRDDTEVSRLVHDLIARCGERGFRIAYSLVRDRSDAEDAVQEALARACDAAAGLRDPAARDSWFLRIVVNVCLRALRRRRLRYLAYARWFDDATAASPPLPGDEALGRREQAAQVVASLDALPARQRAVLVLRYGHDLSIADIADLMEIGAETARTHLSRGLTVLRAALRRKLGDRR